MTRTDSFNRLDSSGSQAPSPASDAAFSSDDGLVSFACPDPDDPNDVFLPDESGQLPEPFEVLPEELCFLRRPFRSEYCPDCFPGGGFDSPDEKDGYSVLHGQRPDARIRYRFGRLHFIRSRIEHDGESFFSGSCTRIPLTVSSFL